MHRFRFITTMTCCCKASAGVYFLMANQIKNTENPMLGKSFLSNDPGASLGAQAITRNNHKPYTRNRSNATCFTIPAWHLSAQTRTRLGCLLQGSTAKHSQTQLTRQPPFEHSDCNGSIDETGLFWPYLSDKLAVWRQTETTEIINAERKREWMGSLSINSVDIMKQARACQSHMHSTTWNPSSNV